MEGNFKTSEKGSAREVTYNKIKSGIILGDLRPGERLLEWELASQFGVSRTPVREAIRQLESEGLVKVEPLKGAAVTKLSTDEIKEIYSIRVILESHAAELTAKNIGGEERKIIKNFGQLFKKHMGKSEYKEWLKNNVAFHLFFASNSGNSYLHKLIIDLRTRVDRYQYVTMGNPDVIKQYTTEHLEIIDAALQGDPKLTKIKMEKHLRNVQNVLTDLLKRFPMMSTF